MFESFREKGIIGFLIITKESLIRLLDRIKLLPFFVVEGKKNVTDAKRVSLVLLFQPNFNNFHFIFRFGFSAH